MKKIALLVLLAIASMSGSGFETYARDAVSETPAVRPDMALVYVYRVGIDEEVRPGAVRISVDGKSALIT